MQQQSPAQAPGISEERVRFDPVKMNIRNLLEADTRLTGPIDFASGVKVLGAIEGDLSIRNGTLWIAKGARVANGAIRVNGNVYVLGEIGDADSPLSTSISCTGEFIVARGAVLSARVLGSSPELRVGSRFNGAVDTTVD